MRAWLFSMLLAGSAYAADLTSITTDPAKGKAFKERYVALTDSWAEGIEFTADEVAAMRAGKQWERIMTEGPDDPLAKKILAAGEPSWAALSAAYPGKILDRTVLGTWSDPREPLGKYNDEFAIYWNGAIACNLIKGKLTDRLGSTGVMPLAHNTVIEFRVGSGAELPGRLRRNYSSIGYERGCLPVVTSSYQLDGVRYGETALAYRPFGETGGWDVAYVAFELTNMQKSRKPAVLFARIVLNDGGTVRFTGARATDETGAALLAASAGAVFDPAAGRLAWSFDLAPGETRRVFFKIPYLSDAKGQLRPAAAADFDTAHRQTVAFWQSLLEKGVVLETPERRINDVWRALLLQNFVLADGPRFTYGSGLRYNDSTYPQENGFGAHTFAMYGHPEYADALQEWFPGMSVTREGAGRKYQNRRAMVLHHLLENYRLTGKTDLYQRHRRDFDRVAEEIVRDRRSTMVEGKGERPLYYGLLPPDKPGADVQASTQTVYVLGHSITNCQGLRDYGRFLQAAGIDRERGERYQREADDFRKCLMSAMRRAAIRIPGRAPFVDLQTLLFRQTKDYGPEPYDDLALGRLQGTYYHYWVDMEFHYNFFNPGDDVGQWLADYVRQRNGFVLGLTRARQQSGPYGWVNNVYDGGYYNFRLRRGETAEFLLGLYSRLAFGMSRYTYVASEGSPFIGYNTERGGFAGADYSLPNSAANADTLLMLRNALVLEELEDNMETGTLWLMKGVPRAWLEPGKRIRVERFRTYFGPVSYRVEAAAGAVRAEIEPPPGDWKTLAIAFRVPGAKPLKSVRVNGVEHSGFDRGGTVRAPHGAGKLTIEARY